MPGARCQGRNSGSGNRGRAGYEKLPGSAFPSLPGLTKDARCLVCCLLLSAFCLLFSPTMAAKVLGYRMGKGLGVKSRTPGRPQRCGQGRRLGARIQDLGFRIQDLGFRI